MRSIATRLLLMLFLVSLLGGCIPIARLRKGDLSKYTTSLDRDTVTYVCGQFDLGDTRLCRPGNVVYAPDFFPTFLASFQRGVSTRADVAAKLGRYEYDCEEPTYYPNLDVTNYWCSYDLNGDNVFWFGVKYQVMSEDGIASMDDVVSGMVGTIGDD